MINACIIHIPNIYSDTKMFACMYVAYLLNRSWTDLGIFCQLCLGQGVVLGKKILDQGSGFSGKPRFLGYMNISYLVLWKLQNKEIIIDTECLRFANKLDDFSQNEDKNH